MIDRSQLTNVFEFVTVAGARARQLLKGCTPRVTGGDKPVSLAQREVLNGEIQKVEPPTDDGRLD